ncbi:MAG: class I SAM-dependent methyltransferase [Dysgonomonas sp.]|nr:class I SAM-dependent methyltransferase [Dysgonomonas sp.]
MNKDTNYYNSERNEIYPFIPDNIKRTLEVGCALGNFSANLKDKKNTESWGIEMEEKVAEVAQSKLDKVIIGAFEDVYTQLPSQYFDCIFFNDVLEHMAYPEDCLTKVKGSLAPDGHIVASIPNVRYIEVLIDLVFRKDWEYKNSGVMDKTHLRFFTKKSMIRMFEKCGYKVKSIKGIRSISPYCLTSLINLLLFNKIEDVKYKQFVIVATKK